jgi:hypothetical protein
VERLAERDPETEGDDDRRGQKNPVSYTAAFFPMARRQLSRSLRVCERHGS